jgi:hypothetical protein
MAERSVWEPSVGVNESPSIIKVQLVSLGIVCVVKENSICLSNGVTDEVLGLRNHSLAGHLSRRRQAMQGGIARWVDVASDERCSHSS